MIYRVVVFIRNVFLHTKKTISGSNHKRLIVSVSSNKAIFQTALPDFLKETSEIVQIPWRLLSEDPYDPVLVNKIITTPQYNKTSPP